MSCKHILPKLSDYLSGVLDPPDRQIVQNHLLKCRSCQCELAELADMEHRIRIALYLQVAHAMPSPQIWASLLERLQAETRRRSARFKFTPEWIQSELPGWLSRPHGLFLAAGFGLAAILLISTLVLQRDPSWLASTLPPATAQGVLTLVPDYLPETGMVETIESEESSPFIRSYHQGDQFITILQQPAPSGAPYPNGRDVAVKGQFATLETGQVERIGYNLPALRPRRTVELTWYTGSYQVQVLSNLPVDEVLKVAESLRPAEK